MDKSYSTKAPWRPQQLPPARAIRETTVKTQAVFLASLMAAAVTTVSSAAPPPAPRVTEVIVLDVGSHLQKLIEISRKFDALSVKYHDAGKVRIWQSSLAGSDTARVVVTIEYPSLLSYAQSDDRTRAGAAEYAPVLAELDASGIKILSDSLAPEVSR